jgi:hypothetical protein
MRAIRQLCCVMRIQSGADARHHFGAVFAESSHNRAQQLFVPAESFHQRRHI